jgi:arginase family enzyme
MLEARACSWAISAYLQRPFAARQIGVLNLDAAADLSNAEFPVVRVEGRRFNNSTQIAQLPFVRGFPSPKAAYSNVCSVDGAAEKQPLWKG